MRKHGWQLPYHPLQVVAVAEFLALGFAFYVFVAPFVRKKAFQYVVMGVYTPLIISAFSLYIWCAAADPADSGVFKSKKYLQVPDNEKSIRQKDLKLGGESTSSIYDANAAASTKSLHGNAVSRIVNEFPINAEINNKGKLERSSCLSYVFAPCALISKCCCPSDESSDNQASEDGMFYWSLCEVKVFEYSKHCRVCDKCVNRFDHRCRWLNNCIGRKNDRQFFTLMAFSLLLFLVDISAKLGSSFSLVPYVIVVNVCTLLAMIATVPLAQLFFFHSLLIKKGISTYDYIIALREQGQVQQGVGTHQSSQMSPASSNTGLSSVSSFSTLQRGSWCTPPRLFLKDQIIEFDVLPPETASVSSLGKYGNCPLKKKNSASVKISPWTLARLNAEEVSRAASEARMFFTVQDSMDDYREKKVQKFEEFVDLHLKPDLVHAIAQMDKVFEQQKIFSDLRKNIETLQKNSVTSLKTLVNLGSEVYMQTEVPDTRSIFVDIGLGFHVEFTWSATLKFVQLRDEKMARQIEEYTDLIASIKAQIKLVCEGIRELLQLFAEVQDRDDRVF